MLTSLIGTSQANFFGLTELKCQNPVKSAFTPWLNHQTYLYEEIVS